MDKDKKDKDEDKKGMFPAAAPSEIAVAPSDFQHIYHLPSAAPPEGQQQQQPEHHFLQQPQPQPQQPAPAPQQQQPTITPMTQAIDWSQIGGLTNMVPVMVTGPDGRQQLVLIPMINQGLGAGGGQVNSNEQAKAVASSGSDGPQIPQIPAIKPKASPKGIDGTASLVAPSDFVHIYHEPSKAPDGQRSEPATLIPPMPANSPPSPPPSPPPTPSPSPPPPPPPPPKSVPKVKPIPPPPPPTPKSRVQLDDSSEKRQSAIAEVVSGKRKQQKSTITSVISQASSTTSAGENQVPSKSTTSTMESQAPSTVISVLSSGYNAQAVSKSAIITNEPSANPSEVISMVSTTITTTTSSSSSGRSIKSTSSTKSKTGESAKSKTGEVSPKRALTRMDSEGCRKHLRQLTLETVKFVDPWEKKVYPVYKVKDKRMTIAEVESRSPPPRPRPSNKRQSRRPRSNDSHGDPEASDDDTSYDMVE